jgi:adenylate cyclase
LPGLCALSATVWLDDEIPAHRAYVDVIDERLQMAQAVVVIWSAEAVKSQWVQSEADTARTDGKLVQLSLDGSRLPRPFDRIQCADLAGWTGDATAPGWMKVVSSVAALTGASQARAAIAHAATPIEPLLAVLAFDNLSGDADLTYFSDGVSEEIQQTVARSTTLRVIGRGSSFQFRGADKAAAHVAAELSATHVLDGSVRRSGPKVRISAQLIECASSTTLWSDRFDRDLSDIFALQDEIAEAVAAALKTAFAPAAPVGAIDPAAYDLYLRARSELGWTDNKPEPVEILEQVVARAPTLASAWAALALARAVRLRRSTAAASVPGLRDGVVKAAQTALGLDPASGVAYIALTHLQPWGRYAERERLVMKALETSPRDPQILTEVGIHFNIVGRARDGMTYVSQAYALDPLLPETAVIYAYGLANTGRRQEAQAAGDALRTRLPDHGTLMNDALWLAVEDNDWERFDTLVREVEERRYSASVIAETLGASEMIRHPRPEDRKLMLDALSADLQQTGTVNLALLTFVARIGLVDEAFAIAEKASFEHMFDETGQMPAGHYSANIILRPGSNRAMIDDVRFVGICARLGLCDYWAKADKWPDFVVDLPLNYDFRAEARRLARA